MGLVTEPRKIHEDEVERVASRIDESRYDFFGTGVKYPQDIPFADGLSQKGEMDIFGIKGDKAIYHEVKLSPNGLPKAAEQFGRAEYWLESHNISMEASGHVVDPRFRQIDRLISCLEEREPDMFQGYEVEAEMEELGLGVGYDEVKNCLQGLGRFSKAQYVDIAPKDRYKFDLGVMEEIGYVHTEDNTVKRTEMSNQELHSNYGDVILMPAAKIMDSI